MEVLTWSSPLSCIEGSIRDAAVVNGCPRRGRQFSRGSLTLARCESMWLPYDERQLLAGYYTIIGVVNEEEAYPLSSLAELLRRRPDYSRIQEYGESTGNTNGNSSMEESVNEVKEYIDLCNRIRKANRILAARELIASKDHENAADVVLVSLTVEGFDLGRRYSWWWTRSGLCFQDYKNHWIWLILGFLGGILGTMLVEFLKSIFVSSSDR